MGGSMEKGLVVCSKAGSDKGSFLAVVDFTDTAVRVCDGKRYKLSRPKLKNLKHIGVTNTVRCDKEISTDKALRTALSCYRSKL